VRVGWNQQRDATRREPAADTVVGVTKTIPPHIGNEVNQEAVLLSFSDIAGMQAWLWRSSLE
jgi:hypothetical protein